MKIREYFVHHPDGSWEPRTKVTIEGSLARVTIIPGVRFRPGVTLGGVDIAKLCEEDAEI